MSRPDSASNRLKSMTPSTCASACIETLEAATTDLHLQWQGDIGPGSNMRHRDLVWLLGNQKSVLRPCLGPCVGLGFFPVASTLAPARPGWTWQRQETHLIRRRKLLLPPKDGVTRMEACTRDMDHFPQIIAIYSGTCRQPQAHNIPAVSVPTKVTIWQTETYLT